MKTLLLISLIAIAGYSGAQETGYYVVIEQTLMNKAKCVKTAKTEVVEQIYFNNFKYKIDIKKSLSGKITYVRHENNNIIFYCERMNIVKKRNGKIKYKKIKKPE